MDDPLSIAQGLSSNNIISVHFDFETGLLWTANKNGLNYSHMRDGGWTHLSKASIGLNKSSIITRLGSSSENIWIQSQAVYLKLDRTSGMLVSVMSFPDQEDIYWSSTDLSSKNRISDNVSNYFFLNGWILNNGILVDPYGRNKKITSYYSSRYGDVWIGVSDGTILKGDLHMETFYPIYFGLINSDVSVCYKDESGFWLGGKSNNSSGITYFSDNNFFFNIYEFDVTINMTPQKIYSISKVNDEIWFGGSMGILVFNKRNDYWRLLDESKTLKIGGITSMTYDSNFVWVGSNDGISRIDPETKRSLPLKYDTNIRFDPSLRNEIVYDIESIDEEIWIGTRYNVFIYDKITDLFHDFRDFGDIQKLDGQENLFSNFWDIEEFKNLVYISSKQGLISYDKITRDWKLIFRSHSFKQQKINTMVFNENFGFFGTNSGLLKFDFNHYFLDEYSYPFIGNVNTLHLTGDYLWLGTSQGLIKYLWKND